MASAVWGWVRRQRRGNRWLALVVGLALTGPAPAEDRPDAAAHVATPGASTAAATGDGAVPRVGFSGSGKQIWAKSSLFAEAPPLAVGTWLTAKPECQGKFVLIEFWRTWCGACKRTAPLLNRLHEKYAGELVVIGITGESAEKVRTAYHGPELKYPLAIDLPGSNPRDAEQGAYEANFGVWGWPHVIIIEPEANAVVWEGFPGLAGYELTEAKIEKILAIGRESRQAAGTPTPTAPAK
jgi:thiol-disulfide isomerase/thioredoxin